MTLKTGEVLPVAPGHRKCECEFRANGAARGFEVAASDAPPLHLFLGADAYDMAHQKIEQVQADLTAWKEMATATDVD